MILMSVENDNCSINRHYCAWKWWLFILCTEI